MRIAVHTAWDPEQAIAEAEIYQRMLRVAAGLGWTCCRTASTREIEKFAPDVVLAEHFRVAKLTAFPTLGLMWNPPPFWSGNEEYIKNVISYDGHLFADSTTRQFVGDLVAPLATRLVEGEWYPTCQATVLADRARAGLAYLHAGWDRDRHRATLARLARSGRMHFYGPAHGALPFDGSSVLAALARHAAALCLHSDWHRKVGTPAARVFEAAAAGAVIICDDNAFVRRTFGDAALYVDTGGAPDRIAAEVLRHLSWIENHPVEAGRLRREAHRIFVERFTFEAQLERLPALVADIGRAWRSADHVAERSVAYVVRTGGRQLSYVDRALRSLEQQTHGNIQAIVVAFRDAESVRRHLSASPAGQLKVTVIETADTGLRSTALWAGLKAVTTDFFGVLDDDDALLPNHVASCLATLDAHPEFDLAYGGTIRVQEDGDDQEARSIYLFSHFAAGKFQYHNSICSNAWLARRASLDRIGPDPAMAVAEDYHLLKQLHRTGNFAPSWRLTAEYRHRTGDSTQSRAAVEREEAFERVRRRQHFSPHALGASLSANDLLGIPADSTFVAGRILRAAIRRRHRRKGLTSYLAEVASLPGRLWRLPSILAAEGLGGILRRVEARGAAEYARRDL